MYALLHRRVKAIEAALQNLLFRTKMFTVAVFLADSKPHLDKSLAFQLLASHIGISGNEETYELIKNDI